jgi:hypothetical protein
VRTRSAVRGAITFSSPDWETERAAALNRIGDIQDAMGRIEPFLQWLKTKPPEHGGPGHNMPPEPLDTQIFQYGIEAANVFRLEVASPTPHSEAIRFCGRIFRDLAGWLVGLVAKLGNKLGVYIDRFMKSAATAAGPVAVGRLAGADFHKLSEDLATLLQQIAHWW